ncbi:MAG: ATP-binding protein [Magnetospirillum sp.]|nr:ATP-binding protein [Magnetospirillum sp.]
MMKPVSVAGRPHVLAVGLFASRFEPLFDRTLAPWSVALLDGGTKTVAMLPREDNLAERHHARIAETVEAGGQGRLALPHADGTEHLLVVERIPPSGWVAVSALPRSIAEEPAKRTALIYAVGALLLALPSVLLASWLGWRLARSMKGLAAFGSAMGHPSPLAALSLPTEGAPCQELEVVAEALQNAAGEIAARDAQLRQQRDLAEESATRIASQSEELARSNTELEQFAYIASHDLREPLRMVSSFLTLLERHLDDRMDDEAREFMGYARDGALRMDQMILDLLQYSRVGRTGTAVETVDLNRLVEQVRRELAPKIAEAGAEVVVESPGLPVIAGDQGELERLFLNLMGNALKYRAPERPARITVSARTAEDGWQVTVADNGIGIEPQFHQRIFAIFQRLHTREKYEGNGIGLAICKKVVEHHGGRIWVDSTPGSGSAFHFTLPAGPPPLPHS